MAPTSSRTTRHGLVTGQRVCFGANQTWYPTPPVVDPDVLDIRNGSPADFLDCPIVSVIAGSTSFSVYGIVVSTNADGMERRTRNR